MRLLSDSNLQVICTLTLATFVYFCTFLSRITVCLVCCVHFKINILRPTYSEHALTPNTMVGGDLSLKDQVQVQVQVLYSHLCVFTVMIYEVIAIKRKKKKERIRNRFEVTFIREKVHSGQRSRSFRVGHFHSEIAEEGIVHGEEGPLNKLANDINCKRRSQGDIKEM